MTGGWGTPRVPVLQAIQEAADDIRRRYRESDCTQIKSIEEAAERLRRLEKEENTDDR